MALLAISSHFCVPRLLTRQVKVNGNQFHMLKKIYYKEIPKTIRREVIIPKRNYFGIFRRKTKREVQLVDMPPPEYELVFRCTFDNWFLSYQHLGFYAVIIVSVMTVFHQEPKPMSPEDRENMYGKSIFEIKRKPFEENETLILVVAFMLLFSLVHYVIGKIPVRIYCHPQQQKYLLYYCGILPNHLKILAMTAGNLEPISSSSFFPWKHDIYQHKETEQKFLLPVEYFRCPADLYIMLGLQKDPNVNYDHKELDKSKERKLED